MSATAKGQTSARSNVREQLQPEKVERRLVRKLDLSLMVYCSLCYFFNYLDRAAFANAYVAGQKEALSLHGNQYNILLSMFTAGYVVAQIPHAIIIQVVAPRIWLPLTMITWSGLTMCSAACTNFSQLCAVRFLQGLMEASLYCGTMYLVGSWYKPNEISKRTSIFTAVGQVGSMFAGVMMTALRQELDQQHGLAGWQWLYILNGAIGIPFALAGFIVLPDLPETTKAIFFDKSEIEAALERLPPKRKDGHNIAFRSLLRRVLCSRIFYVLIVFSTLCGALEMYCTQSLLLLWMKYNTSRFPASAINTYPLGVQAVAISSNLVAGYYIDHTQNRIATGIAGGLLQLISAILLLIPSLPDAGTFFAFYNAGTSYIVNPLLFGWANIICQRDGDDALRSIILYTMNVSQSVLSTFWGILFYPADDAPYWRKGSIVMIIVVALYLVVLFMVPAIDRKERKKTDANNGGESRDEGHM